MILVTAEVDDAQCSFLFWNSEHVQHCITYALFIPDVRGRVFYMNNFQITEE